MATVNITLLNAVRLPEVTAANTTLSVEESLAYALEARGDCVINTPRIEPVPVMSVANPVTGGIELSSSGGVAKLKFLGRQNGVILLGDSRTFHNLQQSDIDAGNYRLRDNGWFTWANVFAGGAFEIIKNAGVSGDTTSQALARYATDVRPYAQASRYLTWLAGTNNIGSNIATAVAALADAISVFELAKSDGLYVFCISELPRGGASAPSVAYYNAGLADYWSKNSHGEYVDVYSALVQPSSATGANISGVYYDGIHLDVGGAYRVGKVVSAALLRKRGSPPPLVSSIVDTVGVNASSSNILDAGLFVAAGGTSGNGASGAVGAGWTLARAGGDGTVVGSLETTSDGVGQAQRLTIDATGGTANTFRLTLSNGVPTRAVPGKVLRCRAKVKVASSTNLHTVAFRCTKTTGEITCLNAIAGTGIIPGESWDGVYVTWPYTIPTAGETTLLPFFDIVITGVGAAVIDVSRVEMRLTDS